MENIPSNQLDQIRLFRFLLKAVERETHSEFNHLLVKNDAIASPNQSEALCVVYHYGPISLKRVGELLISERKSPSRLIQTLVDKGLIRKDIDKDDKRLNVLTLTAAGKAEIKRIKNAEREYYKAISEKLGSNVQTTKLIDLAFKYIKGSDSEAKLNERFDKNGREPLSYLDD